MNIDCLSSVQQSILEQTHSTAAITMGYDRPIQLLLEQVY